MGYFVEPGSTEAEGDVIGVRRVVVVHRATRVDVVEVSRIRRIRRTQPLHAQMRYITYKNKLN
jgi:hypothetical protein